MVRREAMTALFLCALLLLVPIIHTHPLVVSHHDAVSSSLAPTDAVSCALCASATDNTAAAPQPDHTHLEWLPLTVAPAGDTLDPSSVLLPSRAPPAA